VELCQASVTFYFNSHIILKEILDALLSDDVNNSIEVIAGGCQLKSRLVQHVVTIELLIKTLIVSKRNRLSP
jgi:hypothetical protein